MPEYPRRHESSKNTKMARKNFVLICLSGIA
jgi:hypothetical protein